MSQALAELLRGIGAHADPLSCVEDLPAEQAHQRIPGFPHSVADEVFHMNYWMDYELKRIHGKKPKYPEHAAESFPSQPQNWDQLKRELSEFLSTYAKLAQSKRAELDRQIESARQEDLQRAGTLEAVLWQMVAHNSYHTGQIVALRSALGAWPPKSGGDTW